MKWSKFILSELVTGAAVVGAFIAYDPTFAMAMSDATAGAGGGNAALGFALIGTTAAFYLLPAIIALVRGVNFSWALVLINIFFGWTVLGWFVCLIWAVIGITRAQDEYYRRQRGN